MAPEHRAPPAVVTRGFCPSCEGANRSECWVVSPKFSWSTGGRPLSEAVLSWLLADATVKPDSLWLDEALHAGTVGVGVCGDGDVGNVGDIGCFSGKVPAVA